MSRVRQVSSEVRAMAQRESLRSWACEADVSDKVATFLGYQAGVEAE